MLPTTIQQGTAGAPINRGDGLRRLDVTGWSFGQIHRKCQELKALGWTLRETDTAGGRLVLWLERGAQ